MEKPKDMREVYGESLADIGKDKRVVVLDADLSHSNKTDIFAKSFPNRFFEAGIAEANMVGVAAGLSTTSLVPFIHTFSVFAVGRVYDQIRVSVCYQNLNVKIVGTSAGLSDAHDGATHQAIDDIALMRVLPNMTVIVPCDSIEVRKSVNAILDRYGPTYLRLDRIPIPRVWESQELCNFEIGQSLILKEGNDVSIIACGYPVGLALTAANKAEKKGISVEVIDLHTIKPIDKKAIINTAKKTGTIVTLEEHSIIGGMGSAVSEVISEKLPIPIHRIGIKDVFGESALNWHNLLNHHGISVEHILLAIKDSLKRK
jgi:transketolase